MGQVVPIQYIPGDVFTWHKGIGVVEDSTLLANDYHYFTSHMVVKFYKTGEFKTFHYANDITDEDEEVVAFVYESDDGVQVHVLND